MKVISRAEARAQGLTRFFTGRLCKRGHLAERMVANKSCVVCLYASTKRRAQSEDGKQKNLATYARWRRENPQASAAQSKRRYRKMKAAGTWNMRPYSPPERETAAAQGLTRYFTGRPCSNGHVSERMVASKQCVDCLMVAVDSYRKSDRGRAVIATVSATRRARKAGATGSYTAADVARMRRQQHDRCGNPHCRAELHGKGHVDHKNPLKPRKSQPQGTNDRRNLWLLCGRCNVRKHNRPYKEWLAAEAQRRKRAA